MAEVNLLPPGHDQEIALSWKRSHQFGLPRSRAVDGLPSEDYDPSSRLLAAASPVLDELADQVAAGPLCLLLADDDGRILDRRLGTPTLERSLDQISAVPGCRYSEEATGTNAIATTLETGRAIRVTGEEHYLESLAGFGCYGHPIIHPITRRLEGVLDISTAVEHTSDLFVPFVARIVRDIEERLLTGSRVSHQRLFAAFQSASNRRTRPVVALDGDVVLANQASVDLLETIDYVTLREFAVEHAAAGDGERRLRLHSGANVRVRVTSVPGTSYGSLLELGVETSPDSENADRPMGVRRRDPVHAPGVQQQIERLRGRRTTVFVSGLSGAGRSTVGRELGGDNRVTVADSLDALVGDERKWARYLYAAIDRGDGIVVIDDVHLLPPAAAVQVRHMIAQERVWVALTCDRRNSDSEHVAELAAQCADRIELPALRDRTEDIPAIARHLMSTMDHNDRVRLTPSVLDAFARHPWPGNLRELSALLRRLKSRRSAGDITLADLPAEYRSAPPRRLTGLALAEHEAITAALNECDWNKTQAARCLGISRSTLYERIRALGIRG